jgi:hypothetical protein
LFDICVFPLQLNVTGIYLFREFSMMPAILVSDDIFV